MEEANDNLEDAQEMRDHLTLSANIWQGRFDVEAGEVDAAKIKAIKERSMASGR